MLHIIVGWQAQEQEPNQKTIATAVVPDLQRVFERSARRRYD